MMLAASVSCAFSQARLERAAGGLVQSQAVTLEGNVHPLARAEFDRGALDSNARMDRMLLVLAPLAAQQADLDALIAGQQNPRSPLYRHWLTPTEYGTRFGANAADLARVKAWLVASGFTIEEVPAGNWLIVFSGTAGQVVAAFHTEMRRYRVAGAMHLANVQDPQIPAALSGVVQGVVSLNDFRRRSQIRMKRPLTARPQYTAGSTHYLFPADFAAIYNLNPLFGAGNTGAGSTIAIAARSNIDLGDVTGFRLIAGLPASTPAVVLAGADPGLVKDDREETTLDVEWSGAAAPGAAIELVTAASTATTDGIDLAASYIVNHALAPVVAVSYGSCEQEMGAAEQAFYNRLWQQAASQGMSVFVASGDAGAAGCSEASDSKATSAAINGLCSSPYAVCVGGTEFNEGANVAQYWAAANSAGYESALGYIPETVWNESGASGGIGLWASGGGVSTVVAQPKWQAGVAGAGAANGMRSVPDVALAAADRNGYLMTLDNSFWIVSGTSVSAPAFAGIMALVIAQQGGQGQGSANPELYALAQSAHNPFHPTLSGNNSVPGVPGYSASGLTYNLATGLGSVDAALLAKNWGSGQSAGLDFTLRASAGSGAAMAGGTTSFTLSVTESNSAANLVHLMATAPAGVSVSLSSQSLLPGSTVVVMLSVASTAPTGAQNISLTAWDDSGTTMLTYVLTITSPPTLALTAEPASATLAQGGTASIRFTVVTGGSFDGAVIFSVDGLPDGVTAAWAANPILMTSGVNLATLTLTALAGARTGVFSITVIAAGDGVLASHAVSVAVQSRSGSACALRAPRLRCVPLLPTSKIVAMRR